MPLHYILDGYNVVRNPDFPSIPNSSDQRVSLLDFIRTHRPCGSPRNKVSVVFDGSGWADLRGKFPDIEVVFSIDISADERIRRMIKRSGNIKELVVVSDDGDLGRSVKLEGVAVMKVRDFIGKGRVKSPSRVDEDKKLGYTDSYRITEELKRIWLK